MSILFICTKNQFRSLTAEHIFKKRSGIAVRSAGTASDARIKVTSADLNWAGIIFVMENKHQEILRYKFPTQMSQKQIINLNIPDQYEYMDEELVKILEELVTNHLAITTK